MSKDSGSPEQAGLNEGEKYYTIPGLGRNHERDADRLGTKTHEHAEFLRRLRESTHHVAGLISGIRSLMNNPDLESPTEEFILIADNVAAYYKKEGFLGWGHNWKAGIRFNYPDFYEGMSLRFSRGKGKDFEEKDRISLKSVAVVFNYRHQQESYSGIERFFSSDLWLRAVLKDNQFQALEFGWDMDPEKRQALVGDRAPQGYESTFAGFFDKQRPPPTREEAIYGPPARSIILEKGLLNFA